MTFKSLFAAAAVAAAVIFALPAPQAKADVDVDIGIGIGGFYPGYGYYDGGYAYGYGYGYGHDHHYRPRYDGYRISCGKGRRIVSRSGFRDVRPIDCEGRNYAYYGWKHGRKFMIRVNAHGDITRVRRVH